MEKRIFLFLVMLIFFINLVSAAHTCSDGSLMLDDRDEIKIKDRRLINGISLGLIFASEIPAFGRYSAELIIDAKKFSLSNETASTQIELKNEEYTLTLVNLTSEVARITIDGTSGSIEEGDTETIKDFTIFLAETEGSYPGSGSLEGIIGVGKINLNNDKPIEIISVNSIEYLIELFSASNDNTIVTVKKCENKNATIIEVQEDNTEDVENLTVENNTSYKNETSSNVSIEEAVNETQGIDNQTLDLEENIEEDSESEKETPYVAISITLGSILCLILIFLLIRRFKNRA